MPLLEIVCGSFCLALFCGKSEKPIMISSLILQAFFVDVVIFQVVSNLRLASSAFGFKLSQLRRVFGSRIIEGLRVITLLRNPIQLVYQMRLPPGVVKLTLDGSLEAIWDGCFG